VTRVGLTGGIGSGKSAVAGLFAGLGAYVIDADQISRDLVVSGSPVLAEIVFEFGAGVLVSDGSLDRGKLAEIVFGDEAALTVLNGIMHPRIGAQTAARIAEVPAGEVVVYDMPLLVESGLADQWDEVVVVTSPLEDRLTRLRDTRGMTQDQALARIEAQSTDTERAAVADFVIENSGSFLDLERSVWRVWRKLSRPHSR
jgi:dephospho-CoA kinase